jgi:small subunit ribosomal protein S3Ae
MSDRLRISLCPISENANDSLKGRVMEFSLGDLNKEEDQAFRKIKLRVEDVKVSRMVTHEAR